EAAPRSDRPHGDRAEPVGRGEGRPELRREAASADPPGRLLPPAGRTREARDEPRLAELEGNLRLRGRHDTALRGPGGGGTCRGRRARNRAAQENEVRNVEDLGGEQRFRREQSDFESLFRAHYPEIVRYLSVRLGSREEAADLASEVFLEAFKRVPRLRWRGKP